MGGQLLPHYTGVMPRSKMEEKNMPAKKKQQDVQATLFAQASSSADLTWLRVNEMVAQDGDTMSVNMNSATYNAQANCLTIFDGEGNALGVHSQHSEGYLAAAKDGGYTLGDTDGVRLGRALAANTATGLASMTAANDDDAYENCATVINGKDMTLTIRGITTKAGNFARIWSVDCGHPFTG